MSDCLFCRIASGEIPATTVYESNRVLAFMDINPQSKKHALIIPKQHFDGLNDLKQASDEVLSELLKAAHIVAGELGIAQSGYRLVSNCGKDGRQSVPHLHFHVLGGQELSERMV